MYQLTSRYHNTDIVLLLIGKGSLVETKLCQLRSSTLTVVSCFNMGDSCETDLAVITMKPSKAGGVSREWPHRYLSLVYDSKM